MNYLKATKEVVTGLARFLFWPLGGAFPPLVGWLVILAILTPFACILGLLGVGQ